MRIPHSDDRTSPVNNERSPVVFDLITPSVLTALFQVIMIDLVLAGDNAVVIGLAAAGPAEAAQEGDPRRHRRGDRAAHRLRTVTTQLLRSSDSCSPAACCCSGCAGRCGANCMPAMEVVEEEGCPSTDINKDGRTGPRRRARPSLQAATQIVVADVSMSLDNVLAVAGAARDHPSVLIIGLRSRSR
jgi:hypothetical protein